MGLQGSCAGRQVPQQTSAFSYGCKGWSRSLLVLCYRCNVAAGEHVCGGRSRAADYRLLTDSDDSSHAVHLQVMEKRPMVLRLRAASIRAICRRRGKCRGLRAAGQITHKQVLILL